jgi:hypothetical protein
MQRRNFIKITALGAGAVMAGAKSLRSETAPAATPVTPKRPPATIGLPISIEPLAKRDLDVIFDDMRTRAGVTALFPFAYTHEPHRSGPPIANFHGGNYGTPHLQYYHDIPLTLEDMTGPEFGKGDILGRVVTAARKHGMATFPFLLEDNVRPATVPHWETLYEVDAHGRRTDRHPGGPCYNNPFYQRFALGLFEDYARSYEIGGIMWGSERQSGVLNALALSQSSGQDPGRCTCFCEFCQKKGRERGIDPERARQGFGEIEKFVKAGRAKERPRDGYFVSFWRMLLNYPELLAWEKLWVDSRHEFQASLYRKVKSINPALQVGWHVWHNLSFSPFQAAEEDYAAMAPYSDFLRPAVYNRVAGGRFLAFVRGAHSSVFGDLPEDQILGMLSREMGYGKNEAPYEKLNAVGLSADYVERETRRAVDGVSAGATQIWPGVDIEGPAATPESVGQTVKAAFHGGARGIILSRNYVDIKPDNLSGAGAALRELGLI